MTSKNTPESPPPPYPRRRGRAPKPTSHPLGSVIRERRMRKGLSLAQLAEKIGIGPTSVSLVAAMEHGDIPPRRDVAQSLATVLELDPEPLLMWADTRVSPRAADDALSDRARLEALFTQAESPLLARGSARLSLSSRAVEHDVDLADAWRMRSPAASATDPALNQIPILPSGADPDRYRRKPLGYLDRVAIERLIAGRAELIRPIAYELADEDFDRLRRVVHPHGRPLHALISRPLPIVVDAREPYAIRFDRRVILAYCAWDGRELVVLQPPKHRGFARLKAKRESDLEEHIVGQVVTLNWWEPTKS